jgi:hypothetical protein
MRDIENVKDLLSIKLGDVFTFRGYEYKAQSDAKEFRGSVRMQACCRDVGSKAAYMLADILESLPTESMTKAETFLSKNPTELAQFGGFKLYEHPTRGDTAPIYMITPSGRLMNTGFFDLGDFDLALCLEIDTSEISNA